MRDHWQVAALGAVFFLDTHGSHSPLPRMSLQRVAWMGLQARNLQMRRQAAHDRAAAEQLERERQRLEKERLVLEERKRVLRNMKGVQLSDGPLRMKAVGGDTGTADPWCFENPPKSDCDADWERRCGDGSRGCKVVEIPRNQNHWFDARIGNVVGPVFVKRSGTRWSKLEKGDELHGGDVLRTGNGGSVSITTLKFASWW